MGKENDNVPYTIIARVAEFYHLGVHEIQARSRQARVAHPRQVAVFLIREKTGLSFPSIGKVFGIDHTTAMYAYKKIKNVLAVNLQLQGEIQKIKASLEKSGVEGYVDKKQ